MSTGGTPFLQHALPEIARLLGERRDIGYISAAEIMDPPEEWFAKAQHAFARIGAAVHHIRWDAEDRFAALGRANAIMVGGGNTYALLQRLRVSGLLSDIRKSVRENDMPYIGASAGMNIAGMTIIPTNDWNTVECAPPFDGFGFVPWATNPHFLDAQASSAPNREPTSYRIAEFHRFHEHPVLGIEEEAFVVVRNGTAAVLSNGTARARWYERGQNTLWFPHGSTLPLRIGTATSAR
ncbi:MAG: Type 1 glutamine amidotransferase-like domain-containing protein [bacterium]|nr:Type 1 glutamine amidotransferase-like domain-containing protein [bacterium]